VIHLLAAHALIGGNVYFHRKKSATVASAAATIFGEVVNIDMLNFYEY